LRDAPLGRGNIVKRTTASTALLGLLFLVGCGGNGDAEGGKGKQSVPPPAEGVWFTGVVRFHDAGVAIGGETDPNGYILKADHRAAMQKHLTNPALTKNDRKKLAPLVDKRLYLRVKGSLTSDDLKPRLGSKVHVTGTLDVLSAGGVETPLRHFPVLDVVEIKPAETE